MTRGDSILKNLPGPESPGREGASNDYGPSGRRGKRDADVSILRGDAAVLGAGRPRGRRLAGHPAALGAGLRRGVLAGFRQQDPVVRALRSEERRVGKEWRARWWSGHGEKQVESRGVVW